MVQLLIYLNGIIALGSKFAHTLVNLKMVFDQLWKVNLKLRP